jgi:hypothetical protein
MHRYSDTDATVARSSGCTLDCILPAAARLLRVVRLQPGRAGGRQEEEEEEEEEVGEASGVRPALGSCIVCRTYRAEGSV